MIPKIVSTPHSKDTVTQMLRFLVLLTPDNMEMCDFLGKHTIDDKTPILSDEERKVIQEIKRQLTRQGEPLESDKQRIKKIFNRVNEIAFFVPVATTFIK
jgi:hypothetical protein